MDFSDACGWHDTQRPPVDPGDFSGDRAILDMPAKTLIRFAWAGDSSGTTNACMASVFSKVSVWVMGVCLTHGSLGTGVSVCVVSRAAFLGCYKTWNFGTPATWPPP
jgi:hypothetical protein